MEKDMTINEEVDDFINGLPEAPDKRVYIVLYNTDFHKNFMKRICELRSEEYAERVTLLDKNAAIAGRRDLWIFKPTHYYVGNGYN